MDASMQKQALEIDLRKALIEGEFALFYQSLIDLKSPSVTGFEALIRWHHPVRGLVLPSEFIPLAEEIGLLVPLGKWALREASFEAMGWPAGIKVAVNVSVTQFAGRTLVEDVAVALRNSGLKPARLELEIISPSCCRTPRRCYGRCKSCGRWVSGSRWMISEQGIRPSVT